MSGPLEGQCRSVGTRMSVLEIDRAELVSGQTMQFLRREIIESKERKKEQSVRGRSVPQNVRVC